MLDHTSNLIYLANNYMKKRLQSIYNIIITERTKTKLSQKENWDETNSFRLWALKTGFSRYH